MVSRRDFLKMSAAGMATLYVSKHAKFLLNAFASAQSDNLRKFVQPLRRPGADIPIARPDSVNPGWWQPNVTHYTIETGQYEDQLHPDLPNPTRLLGYGQGGNFKHLGGIIAATRGDPVQITFRNNLPANHILPIDRTIMGADMGDDRMDVHLHGGLVPWISDGGPHAWWRPNGEQGSSFVNNTVLNPSAATNEAEYYYPNHQSARLMWYHDHVFGLTRLNAYAGLATAYVIYDDYELSLVADHHLPGPLDPRTVYLVFQDKTFVGDNILAADPTWGAVMPNSRKGDLWYAHVYDADLGPTPAGLPPDPSCLPEFFGDTMLVNGSVYPYLEVEQRQYRFRMLNACQARFLNMRLVYADPNDPTEPRKNTQGPAFLQFGTEGGFLPRPVGVSGSIYNTLLMSPAERADLIVDFRHVPAGSTLILYNNASAPYPMGDDGNDYYPENPSTPASKKSYGPNTRTLLQIRVKARSGAADAPVKLPGKLTPTDAFLVNQNQGQAKKVPRGVPVRRVTLNEGFDDYGRLIQKLGNDQFVTDGVPPDFGRSYDDTPTEVVSNGAMEVWEIVNLTGDTHPIHFHLVNVQLLARQTFKVNGYRGGVPEYRGPLLAPQANELGWKETVRVNPGQVARVLMKFNLPSGLPFSVPPNPRLLSEHGITGAEYVWHCHILEHEEHDMMRPLVVT